MKQLIASMLLLVLLDSFNCIPYGGHGSYSGQGGRQSELEGGQGKFGGGQGGLGDGQNRYGRGEGEYGSGQSGFGDGHGGQAGQERFGSQSNHDGFGQGGLGKGGFEQNGGTGYGRPGHQDPHSETSHKYNKVEEITRNECKDKVNPADKVRDVNMYVYYNPGWSRGETVAQHSVNLYNPLDHSLQKPASGFYRKKQNSSYSRFWSGDPFLGYNNNYATNFRGGVDLSNLWPYGYLNDYGF